MKDKLFAIMVALDKAGLDRAEIIALSDRFNALGVPRSNTAARLFAELAQVLKDRGPHSECSRAIRTDLCAELQKLFDRLENKPKQLRRKAAVKSFMPRLSDDKKTVIDPTEAIWDDLASRGLTTNTDTNTNEDKNN